jgi:hypothetical protein
MWDPTMSRSIISFVLFAAIFGFCYILMQQGKAPPAPQPHAAEVKPPDKPDDNAEADPAEKKTEKQKADRKPAAAQLPIILKRWPLPQEQKAPDRSRGISIYIDPTGPYVLTESKTGTIVWDAATGATRSTSRVLSELAVSSKLGADHQPLTQIRNRNSGRMLVELKNKTEPRGVCLTPDGKRLIVVDYPDTKPAYDLINPMTGKTYHHDAEPSKNVELYDIADAILIDNFGPKDYGLDDNIWAVASAADGKSFFLVNKTHLIQVNFERAFGVAPLRPR